MKINNTSPKKSKKLFLPLLIVAILLAIWLVFSYIKGMWPFEAGAKDTISTEQTITPEDQKKIDSENNQEKKDFLDKEESGSGDNTNNTPDDTNQNPENDSSRIDLSARTQDKMLVITTDLSTVTSGECILTLEKGQKSVTKKAKVIFAPNSSTCEGFSIDQSELESGLWKITLSVKTNNDTLSKSINYTL